MTAKLKKKIKKRTRVLENITLKSLQLEKYLLFIIYIYYLLTLAFPIVLLKYDYSTCFCAISQLRIESNNVTHYLHYVLFIDYGLKQRT